MSEEVKVSNGVEITWNENAKWLLKKYGVNTHVAFQNLSSTDIGEDGVDMILSSLLRPAGYDKAEIMGSENVKYEFFKDDSKVLILTFETPTEATFNKCVFGIYFDCFDKGNQLFIVHVSASSGIRQELMQEFQL